MPVRILYCLLSGVGPRCPKLCPHHGQIVPTNCLPALESWMWSRGMASLPGAELSGAGGGVETMKMLSTVGLA